MPFEIATDAGLLARLKQAAQRGVSVAERRQQRLSFVFANMPDESNMTRHDVERALAHVDEMEGRG